jgi:hypothetical protein
MEVFMPPDYSALYTRLVRILRKMITTKFYSRHFELYLKVHGKAARVYQQMKGDQS